MDDAGWSAGPNQSVPTTCLFLDGAIRPAGRQSCGPAPNEPECHERNPKGSAGQQHSPPIGQFRTAFAGGSTERLHRLAASRAPKSTPQADERMSVRKKLVQGDLEL